MEPGLLSRAQRVLECSERLLMTILEDLQKRKSALGPSFHFSGKSGEDHPSLILWSGDGSHVTKSSSSHGCEDWIADGGCNTLD
ncbi:unnamed protein product [Prunus armeniaca]|uniref:Uncharacterized protein n=1 Tax=Prunus armeniaca TaxID=36596 RepID=A0A6J5V5K5_PRUAR|nr:unnamed protein product [Prunus armeniaca]